MLRSKRRARDFVDDQAEEEDEQRYRRGQGQQNRVRWAERVDKEECSPPRGPRHGAPSFALDENEEEEDEDEAHFVKVLSIHCYGLNTVAAAYYDSDRRRLKILEDTKDTWAWDLCLLLCEQFLPDQILLSANAPDSLVKVISDFCAEFPQCSSMMIPQREFQHTMAQYRLANVRLPHNEAVLHVEEGEEVGEEDATGAGLGRMRLSLLKMGCRVNVDAPCSVSAAGALIAHVARLDSTEAQGDETPFTLDAIESMDMEEHMLINQDALTSLAVFDIESHASLHSKDNKQGLSLNSVLDTTITPLGKKLFHTWLLRPLINQKSINARLDAVQVLSRKDNAAGRNQLRRELRGFKNMLTFCTKIKTGKGTGRDWQALVVTLTSASAIKETLAQMTIRAPLEIKRYLNEDVQLFLSDVVAIIDWDSSSDQNRICVRDGIDDQIDKLRADYASLEPLLNQMSLIMSRSTPRGMCEDVKVIYIPQLGNLVAASNIYRPELIPPDWHEQFEAKGLTYFKTPEMVNLDDHNGDIMNVIIDLEIEWVQRLIERLEPLEHDLMCLADGIAEADCLPAYADAVDRFGFKRPVIKDEPILKIKNGWHPLHTMCMPNGQYIPNHTMLSGGMHSEHSTMMVVTGANGSGKSAYGKQVALIAYMAHIGCFVPAEAAEIGICDKIFTRVQTRESASKTASAFMIDLGQVSQALRGATARSLIILDEFGKGTSPSDGAGLLAGVVTHLLNGPNPRTVVLTHFHEIFAQQFIDPGLPLLHCHMKCIIVEGSNQPTYLYKVTPDLSLSSNAAECALAHGISEEVVARAREVSRLIAAFQITSLIDAQLTDADRDEMVLHEELTRQFLEWDLDDDDMDVLGELEELLLRTNAAEEPTPPEEVQPGESSVGVWAIERSVVEATMGGDFNNFDNFDSFD